MAAAGSFLDFITSNCCSLLVYVYLACAISISGAVALQQSGPARGSRVLVGHFRCPAEGRKAIQFCSMSGGAEEDSLGGISADVGEIPQSKHEKVASGGSREEGSGVIPGAEDLAHFVSEIILQSPEFGLKRVAQALKEGKPMWTVGEKRLQKTISEVKTGSKEAKLPVHVESVALDDDGRLSGSSEGLDFSFRSFHDAFDLSNEAIMSKLVADCKVMGQKALLQEAAASHVLMFSGWHYVMDCHVLVCCHDVIHCYIVPNLLSVQICAAMPIRRKH